MIYSRSSHEVLLHRLNASGIESFRIIAPSIGSPLAGGCWPRPIWAACRLLNDGTERLGEVVNAAQLNAKVPTVISASFAAHFLSPNHATALAAPQRIAFLTGAAGGSAAGTLAGGIEG